jgi:hypothetical protein
MRLPFSVNSLDFVLRVTILICQNREWSDAFAVSMESSEVDNGQDVVDLRARGEVDTI